MTEHSVRCKYDADDVFTALPQDGDGLVGFQANRDGDVTVSAYVRPDDARAFARGILALADEIDGGEEPTVEPDEIRVGDRVRILHAKWAEETHGKLGTVTSATADWQPRSDVLHPYAVRVDGHDRDIYAAEVERVKGEPAGLLDEAGLDDWERDLIEASEAAKSSPFATHVDEAKRLLAGTTHTGADVVALAVELADRN